MKSHEKYVAEPPPTARKFAAITNWSLGTLGIVAGFIALQYPLVDGYHLVRTIIPVVTATYLVLLGVLIFLFHRERIIKEIIGPAGIMFVVVFLLCSQALQLYNVFADASEQKKTVYTVLEKQYASGKNGWETFTLVTDGACPLNVERRIYQRVREGDKFTLITKKGKLGVEWIVGFTDPPPPPLR